MASDDRDEPQNAIVDSLCEMSEGDTFECKRVAGAGFIKNGLRTLVALSNANGGYLVAGLEDPEKAVGKDRIYGIEEKQDVYDEFRSRVETDITPLVRGLTWVPLRCHLRDGVIGTIVIIVVGKSKDVHSVAGQGTFIREGRRNRHMTAAEVSRLSVARGIVTAEKNLTNVDPDLLNTEILRHYCTARRVGRPELSDRLLSLGFAKRSDGSIKPNLAAVLLFADHPGNVLGMKVAVRVFVYEGSAPTRSEIPNYRKKPVSFSGPILRQIADSYEYVIQATSGALYLAKSGFRTEYKFPERVIREAITNAVIHRDYSVNQDIFVKIFDNRIEIDSPGTLPGAITVDSISEAGSFSRNPLIVSTLRELPEAPNIDAGEGVPMMFNVMRSSGLYPPLYFEKEDAYFPVVRVTLLNEEQAPIWDQVSHWIEQNGPIANRDLCVISGVETLEASRMLSRWVEQGLLIGDSSRGKRFTEYRKPGYSKVDTKSRTLSKLLENKNKNDR